MFIVGGVNIMFNLDMFLVMFLMILIFKDGRFYVFDSCVNGYGCGEGLVIIIFKRFDDVLWDGDLIWVIIWEIGVN